MSRDVIQSRSLTRRHELQRHIKLTSSFTRRSSLQPRQRTKLVLVASIERCRMRHWEIQPRVSKRFYLTLFYFLRKCLVVFLTLILKSMSFKTSNETRTTFASDWNFRRKREEEMMRKNVKNTCRVSLLMSIFSGISSNQNSE